MAKEYKKGDPGYNPFISDEDRAKKKKGVSTWDKIMSILNKRGTTAKKAIASAQRNK